MDILLGLLVGIVGLVIAFSGLRVFFTMLPIVALISGFTLGATLITNWLGDRFLATITGWIVGIVLGLLFAYVSYMWWYIGALMAAGASGALLLSGLFTVFGVNNGVVLTIVAIIGAVLFIIGAMVLNLPVYVVLVNTAISGSHMAIAGLLLALNRVELEEFSWGAARTIVNESWFWGVLVVVLIVAAIFSQMKAIASIRLPQDPYSRIDSAS